MSDDVKRAIAELDELVVCRCSPAYVGRKLRDPDCYCGYTGEVDTISKYIEELEAKLAARKEWHGVLEWLDDDTITRVDWVAGGGDPSGEFCRLGLHRTMPDGTELFRTYVAMDEWAPCRSNPFGLGIDGGDA
jgi:hypothetical protein